MAALLQWPGRVEDAPPVQFMADPSTPAHGDFCKLVNAQLDPAAALETAPEPSEEELARQALDDGGADPDPATPE